MLFLVFVVARRSLVVVRRCCLWLVVVCYGLFEGCCRLCLVNGVCLCVCCLLFCDVVCCCLLLCVVDS